MTEPNMIPKEVIEVGQMNFEGNITPHSWYQTIRRNGKADLIAITLLADVVYWYRPVIERDEATGAVIGMRKKFAADMLQKTYEPWGNEFGFTKRQTVDAVKRLIDIGLLKRELRTVTTKGGMILNNVTFFAPIPGRIRDITYRLPSPAKKGEVSLLNETPSPPESDTSPARKGDITEITTEITPETTKNIPPRKKADPSSPFQQGDDFLEVASKCAASKEQRYADPLDDVLIDTAIALLCNGRAPKKGNGTYRDMANVIGEVHIAFSLNDERPAVALSAVRQAVELFMAEKPDLTVYRYPSFQANYGQYLSRVLSGNGSTKKGARQPTSEGLSAAQRAVIISRQHDEERRQRSGQQQH